MAASKGLILVDTKYEFGKADGRIYLIDEIHTPDSSRYFYADGYQERFDRGDCKFCIRTLHRTLRRDNRRKIYALGCLRCIT